MANDSLDGLSGRFGTILVDPPWRFMNRTGKMAPEHKRRRRHSRMSFKEIAAFGDHSDSPRRRGRANSIGTPAGGERVLDPLGFDARITRVIASEEDGFVVTTTEHGTPVFVTLDDPKERVWLLDPPRSYPGGKCRTE